MCWLPAVRGQSISTHSDIACSHASSDCAEAESQAALEAGKCVVIGLQSTGEARTLDVVAERAVDGELDDFVSGPKVTALPAHAGQAPAITDMTLLGLVYSKSFTHGSCPGSCWSILNPE